MINKRTARGESPLLVAVSRDQLQCVEVLLENGADPDIMNHENETPLYKGKQDMIITAREVQYCSMNLLYLVLMDLKCTAAQLVSVVRIDF